MEIEIWSIGVPLPISHDAFPDADPVVRGWLGSTGAIPSATSPSWWKRTTPTTTR